MLTKAIIIEVKDKYSAKIRIPSIHKVAGATYAYADSELPTATICTAAGNAPALQVGDVVFVDFEDDLEQQPVILGWLYREGITTRSNIDTASLSANVKCELPSETSIGNTTSWDINNIKNSKENLQVQIDKADTSITANTKDIASNTTRIIALEKADTVIEYKVTSTNWYRLYESGWLEQGGTGSTSAAITFPKNFKDTTYVINVTPLAKRAIYVNTKTVSNVTVAPTSGSTATSVDWIACGQIAST